MLLRRKRKPSLKVRELQEEDQAATKRHASKRHSESLQERQERLQRDAQAHASKRHSESLQERQERLQRCVTVSIISGAYEGRSVQLRGTAFESERLRHFPFMDIGIKCCFHSQRITPHAPRLRYTARRTQAYVRIYTALARGDSKLRFTITARDGAGKGRRDRKAPKVASHDATSACKKI